MNPGTWVMGGGAGGGGAGGGDGDGTDGAGGAGGENDGQNGEGNGNGAGSCGQGGAGACTNCASQTSAGDPIDVVTGEVFTGWKTDLFLPGFFNLDIRRKYTSAGRKRDVGFGYGWIHSLAWEIREDAGGKLTLTTGGGFRAACAPLPNVGDQAFKKGWALLRTTWGFLLRAGDEFLHAFESDEKEPAVYRLTSIRYRQRGIVKLAYDQGKLVTVTDTAGRTIVFERGQDGRIARLLVPEPNGPTTVFARYAYDDAGNLTQITDGDGFVTSHAYDDDHRLVRTTHPTGLTFHFVYDERGRGVETWGDYPGLVSADGVRANDPALADDVPEFLADGTTVAKGIHHVRLTFFDDGTSEVIDSVRFHRFFGSAEHHGTIVKALDSKGGVTVRTLDEEGNEISHEDPLGAVWSWEYDIHGGVIRETDPEGHTIRTERDDESRILRLVDAAGGTVNVSRNAAGEVEWVQDQRGGTAFQRRDARGQVVEFVDRRGGTTRIAYDAYGNVVEETNPRGAVTRYEHDYLGRRVGVTVPRGGTESYRYSTMGKLLEQRDLLGRRRRWAYDGMGEVVAHTRADGQTIHLLRGGNGWIYAQIMPGGDRLDWRYNREGWVSFVQNEKGERHHFGYDADGLVIEERGFDDSARTYERDARGRIVAVTDVDRGTREIARNLLGQPITETTAEGESFQYDYDANGRLVRAAGPHTCVSWVRDAAGDVVEERCDVDGASYRVESTLDPEGRKTAYRTSLGHEALLRRDDTGAVQEIWADGKPCVAFVRDENGTPTLTSLSQGGVLRELWDDADRLIERRVERPGLAASRDVPEWVGGDGNISTAWRYQYDALSEVSAVESTRDGVLTYEYDLRRRLHRASRNGEVVEAYFVDPAGNTVPRPHGNGPGLDGSRGSAGARAPVIEKGNRLVWSDRYAYTFDAAGFLREKRDSTNQAITRYTYDGHDLLSRVELPNGEVVSFLYDHAARRVQKLVAKKQPDDSELPLRTTHYVWDGVALRHSITFFADGTTRRRTYLSEDDDFVTPLGHFDGEPGNASLRYYVTRLSGMPEQIVDGAGNVIGSMARDAYGKLLDESGETTEARAAGQWEDAETGLFYNRYRYFDPAIGRYISPDPIGLAGGENLYAYGPNPLGWVDPLGWAGHSVTVTTSTTGFPEGTLGTSQGIMDQLAGRLPSGRNTGSAETNLFELAPTSGPDGRRDIRVLSGGTCSERNLLGALNPDSVRGQTLTMSGRYPPCPACHEAMNNFARDNGMQAINYRWGSRPEDVVTYPGPGGAPPALPTTVPEGARYTINADGTFAGTRRPPR
jgi:RHS repeat-associated protein